MACWTDIFTVETWAAAGAREYTVSGFPPPTTGRGGYHQSTFEQVVVGDRLACYVKAPAKRWVGILRVESAMYQDVNDAIWGETDEGGARFPARFRTAPIIALGVEEGLPVEETLGVLECMDRRAWSGMFRRSLTRMPDQDCEKLAELLSVPRAPSPIRLPRKRPPKVKVVAPTDAIEHPEPQEPEPRGTPHSEIVWKLIVLGRTLGCEVWVASDERHRSYDGNSFIDNVLTEFPSVGLDPESRDLVRSIDVLWIRGKAIAAAFEVEATTSIYSGLLRMSDLLALQPNTSIDLFIVAPDERAAKVHSEIVRPTFESFDPPLRNRCRYLSASRLNECIERTKPPLNRHLQPSVIRDFAESVSVE